MRLITTIYDLLYDKTNRLVNTSLFCSLVIVLVWGSPINLLAAKKGETANLFILSEDQIVLNSHGFHAQKKSGFSIGGVQEGVERGLTVVHFKTSSDYEFKSFDTYGSEKASEELMTVLKKLQENNAVFAVLAHDSAAGALSKYAEELQKLGFTVLGRLKNRQAYAMHNFNGKIEERVDDVSIRLNLDIPDDIRHEHEYFPRIRYEFEPSNDRYIAHAGGEVDGIKSTNSLEALDQNYRRGFRLFELDIIKTKDGQLVAAHDWKMWARFTDYTGELPVTHAEFKKHKIYGKYTTMDFEAINRWFAAHPDAILVTDKVNDPIQFAEQFVDKSRLVMELFSLMSIEEASKNGISPMISQEPLAKIKGDKLTYLEANKVQYVALSRRIIQKEIDLLLALRDAGIKVYVYNVNFDPGKDEKYVQENEIGLVYGMYADKWVFDPAPEGNSK
ncbi:hypothetical protein FK220_006960 [Flavobacteriaceae bacterium TP-CH-4]|uniref:Glycerophosphoryl diester phosphodiesterase n=1 Tax=Pelagihabitans pacificus TaxID=2696054 RepID=A0A967E550_9FLAO|nr:glycerophosphodiester phosphodiesterase family protein [Pelagihabitans pacificus]NHF59072.1 hypothetical protein [Pelagihabitans pacificus]